MPHPLLRMARFNPDFCAARLGRNTPGCSGSGFGAARLIMLATRRSSTAISWWVWVRVLAALAVKSFRRRRCFANFFAILARVHNHRFDGGRRPFRPRVPGTLGPCCRSAFRCSRTIAACSRVLVNCWSSIRPSERASATTTPRSIPTAGRAGSAAGVLMPSSTKKLTYQSHAHHHGSGSPTGSGHPGPGSTGNAPARTSASSLGPIVCPAVALAYVCLRGTGTTAATWPWTGTEPSRCRAPGRLVPGLSAFVGGNAPALPSATRTRDPSWPRRVHGIAPGS